MHSAATALASVRGIRMSFGGVEVLKDVDLELLPGEVHAITGENGAGKSTLAKIIAGVYRPTRGHINVEGHEVHFESPAQASQAGIALIHQEPMTFPHLSVAENIYVGRQPRTRMGAIDRREMARGAARALEQLGVKLDPRARLEGMSIANRQMVELAAALSQDAKVLMLDETTASLTPKEVDDLFRVIRQLRERGCALAFVSHRLEEVMEICDRVTVLRDGAKVGELTPATSGIPDIVRLMVGRESESIEKSKRQIQDKVALQVNGLSSRGRFANISLQVRAGEIVAIAGLVGAGRTELVESIFGAGQIDSGSIAIDGKEVDIRSTRQALASGLALVPEDRQHHGLLLPMSILDNATLSILSRLSRIWTSDARQRAETSPYVEKLRIALRDLAQPADQLSGGNQQKVVLAKWLLTHPKVLIVDEPTRGVDVGAKAEVHRLLFQLAGEGMAILMVSSDLPEVLLMADRILVMRAGGLTAEFTGGEATAEKVMFAATGQEAHA